MPGTSKLSHKPATASTLRNNIKQNPQTKLDDENQNRTYRNKHQKQTRTQ